MAGIKIETLRGTIIQDGNNNAVLEWNPDFAQRKTQDFNKTQMYIDSEVLRFCSARVPQVTGMLMKSGILGTVIGSGEVNYIAPYAAAQYYDTSTTRSYDSNRGAKWFERGKIDERDKILANAQKIAGGQPNG